MYSPGEGGEPRVPVLPHVRIVPSGAANGATLRATLLVTPDACPKGDPSASLLSMQDWPSDIFGYLATGRDGPEPGSVWVEVVGVEACVDGAKPDLAGLCRRAGRVQARVRGLTGARSVDARDRDDLVPLWRQSVLGPDNPSKAPWHGLAEKISTSLEGSGVKAGKIEDEYAAVTPAGEGSFGRAGQLVPQTAGASPKIDAIIEVPHADLALALEFQRVDELRLSIEECYGRIGARAAAERARTPDRPQPDRPKPHDENIDDEVRRARIEQHKALSPKLAESCKMASRAYVREIARLRSPTCAAPSPDVAWANALSPGGAVDSDGRDARFDASVDAHRYATWPQYADNGATSSTNGDDDVARNFFALQSHPSLARAFGLAFEVEIELADLQDNIGMARYLFLSVPLGDSFDAACGTSSTRDRVWTLAKLVGRAEGWHFWPVTEEEVHAALLAPPVPTTLNQFEGVLVMGAGVSADPAKHWPRYDLTTLDVRTATELEARRREARAEVPNPDFRGDDLAFGTTLQTPGITILCRSAQADVARGLARRTAKSEPPASASASAPAIGCAVVPDPATGRGHVVLDAEDLTIGYRLAVGIPRAGGGTEWRPLMNRYIRFGAGNEAAGAIVERVLGKLVGVSGSSERVAIESAFLATPSRLVPTGDGNSEAVTDQAVATWPGEPMGVDCGAVARGPVRVKDNFPFGRELNLPEAGRRRSRGDLSVSLRHGWPYRVALPVVYSGGVSLPLAALPEEDRRGTDEADIAARLFYPPLAVVQDVPGGRAFFRALRQARIAAPLVLLPAGHATRTAVPGPLGPRFVRGDRVCGPMGYEQGAEMVVRSLIDLSAVQRSDRRITCRQTPDMAQRLVLVPSLPLDDVARHGVFDRRRVEGARPLGAFPSLQFSEGEEHFPVTRTTRIEGIDGRRFTQRRSIDGSPSAERFALPEAVLGDAVFARGSSRQSSYYPDPAADAIAVGLRRVGEAGYLPGGPVLIPVLESRTYPDVLPVLLTLVKTPESRRSLPVVEIGDVVSGPRAGRRVRFDPGRLDDVTRGSGYPAQEVRLALAAGEEFEVDLWCVPSPERLAREFSLIQSLGMALAQSAKVDVKCDLATILAGAKACLPCEMAEEVAAGAAQCFAGDVACVGPGGVVAPSMSALLALAVVVHRRLACHPIPEIASVGTVRAVHACNRAFDDPVIVGLGDADPFPAPAFDPATRVPAGAMQPLMAFRPNPPGRSEAEDSLPPPGPIDVAAPRSTRLVMSGDVAIDLSTNDTIEVVAKVALPGSSAFDDPTRGRSLAQRQAGTWPKRLNLDGTLIQVNGLDQHVAAGELFGFDVAPDGRVTHPSFRVTLLRVENLPRHVSNGRISLRQCFEETFDGTELAGARVTHRHQFPDGKARIMEVWVNALSRTAGRMRTTDRLATGSDPWLSGQGLIFQREEAIPGEALPPATMENASGKANDGGPGGVTVILPATVVPAVCDARAPDPCFQWKDGDVRDGERVTEVWRRRKALLYVPLGRPWFTCGQGERVGIVLWPPVQDMPEFALPNRVRIPPHDAGQSPREVDVTGFTDDDLGPGGAFVTRRGADPVKGGGSEKTVFMSLRDLPDAGRPKGHARHAECVEMVEMPLTDEASASDGGPRMMVSLVTYEPRFNPESEEWYIVVETTELKAPDAFVRLGLVRYQPNAPKPRRCSRPVVQWAQPLPLRRASARRGPEEGSLVVEMHGKAFTRRKRASDLAQDAYAAMAAPCMKVTLFEQLGDARLRVLPPTGSSDDEAGGYHLCKPSAGADGSHWQLLLGRNELSGPRESSRC